MSEERFYNQFREKLQNYAPEVPAGVYAGMRRKLWWSNFTRLSVTRFNLWYTLLITGIAGVVLTTKLSDSCAVPAAPNETQSVVIPPFKSFDTICARAKSVEPQTAVDQNASATTGSNHVSVNSVKRENPVGVQQIQQTAPTKTTADAVTSAESIVSPVETSLKNSGENPSDAVNPIDAPVAKPRKGRALKVNIPVDSAASPAKDDKHE